MQSESANWPLKKKKKSLISPANTGKEDKLTETWTPTQQPALAKSCSILPTYSCERPKWRGVWAAKRTEETESKEAGMREDAGTAKGLEELS